MMREMEGKRVAVFMTRRTSARSVEVAVVAGTVRSEGDELVLDRGPSRRALALDEDVLERFRQAPVFMRHLFADAEFVLPVAVARFPKDADCVIPYWFSFGEPSRS